MTKSELVEIFSQKTNVSKKLSEDIIDMLFDSMTKTLVNGSRIEIRGFGAFSVRNYKSYSGRNPKTGITVFVKPKKLPFFKVGRELKLSLNTESTT